MTHQFCSPRLPRQWPLVHVARILGCKTRRMPSIKPRHGCDRRPRSSTVSALLHLAAGPNRVGGRVTPRLSHQRTYGSVYGGSPGAREPAVLFEEAHEAHSAQHSSGHGLPHVTGTGVPPGTSPVEGGAFGAFGVQPQVA